METIAPTQLSAQDKEQLARRYVPLVRTLARRVAVKLPGHVDAEDLVQEGMVGLLDALNRFDPSKGIQFQSYASSRIRGAMLDSLRTADWVSRGARRRARELQAHEEHLLHTLGRQPNLEELAEFCGLTRGELHRRRTESNSLSLVSLQQPATHTEDESCWADQLMDEGPGVEDTTLRQARKAALMALLQLLSERERSVLWLYYFEEFSIREIGKIFGVSEARISQIHSRCLRKLRENFQASKEAC